MPGFRKSLLHLLVLVVHLGSLTQAGDWPQILGPQRNGVAENETLLERWPDAGPMELWQCAAGSGFAGVSVAGERVAFFCREGDAEVMRLLDAATGREFWASRSACQYRGGVSSDKGPRCVPLIDGNHVYLFGVEGLLRCLSLTDGSEIWKVDTNQEFSPLEGYFGVGSTPVIHDQLLIVNVGGRDDAAVVAFDKASGRTVWKTGQDHASYSSPIAATLEGRVHVLVLTRLHLWSLDPSSGQLRFQMAFGKRGPTVNGATPVVVGNDVFVSASYGVGALLARVNGPTASEVWRDEDLLATQYATPVLVAGRLYAVDGRQDAGPGSARVRCIDLTRQRVLWEQSGFDYGSLVSVGRDLLFLTCGGELIRFEASPEKYREIQRAVVLSGTDRGYRLPALSRGRLFVRDDSRLKALKVGETP